MSEDKKKPSLPVSTIFDELSAGGELTAVQVLNSLMVSDKSLALKTQINDPVVVSVLDVLVAYAKKKGYTITATILENLLKSYRENMVSFKRQGRKEIIQGVVADLERAKSRDEDLANRLVGRGKR